jgi:GH15 family glucan-1,4-alpha-glucosidase
MTGTYTTATVYAALIAASDLATGINDNDNSIKWRSAANDIRFAAQKYLYNNNRKVFYKGLKIKDDQITYIDTIDSSSVFGPYIFGLFDAHSDEMTSSINTITEVFCSNNDTIGLPRYENDNYRRTNPSISGNYWFVTTLWLAQYYIDNDEKEKVIRIIDWVHSHSMSTGIMGEQLDPISGEMVAPAPLTWTHAEYVSTLLDLVAKQKSS